MNQLILIILGIVIGVFLVFLFTKRNGEDSGFESDKQKFDLIEKQAREKKENLDKILKLFESKETVVNNDVENLLGISDATSTRYLDDLEKLGKIQQIGKTGKYTYYKKV